MARLWKEVLLVGRQRDRFGNWFEFKPRDVRDALANARKMLARGLSVPAVWEHQPIYADHKPKTAEQIAEWKRNYARFTFGSVVGARINGRGNLDFLHDVPDPEDVEQLHKTRFVSPAVFPSYSDSLGGEYRGTTVAHVAATPTPVQHWQRPWELSRPGALYMSYAPARRKPVPCTVHSVSRSTGATLLSATRDGGRAVSDPKDDPKDKDKGGDLGALIQCLRDDCQMSIPDEVKDIPGLIIACKALGMSGGAGAGGGGGPSDDDLNLDAGSGATTSAPGAPMMMSTTSADPHLRGQALSWAEDERRYLKGRIEALYKSGRIDVPTAHQLNRQRKSIEMSFTAEAVAVSPLHKKLEEYEKRPKDFAWKAAAGEGRELSATRPADAPRGATAGGDAKATTDWLCAGLPAAAKK